MVQANADPHFTQAKHKGDLFDQVQKTHQPKQSSDFG